MNAPQPELSPRSFVLTMTCKDRPGLVSAVASTLLGQAGNITDAAQFNDQASGDFFMRVQFETPRPTQQVAAAIQAMSNSYGMRCRLRACDEPHRVLMMVSQFDHCLGDLLYRARIGELNMDVVGIVANHPREVMKISVIGDIPFHYLPVTKDTKPGQEARVREIMQETGTELVVLARYMQILSDEMSAHLSGRCINIHHAFLPSFKGAKPYHQAYSRGVKIIGATAHYVTADLDEGPIISQDIEHITHADSPDDLVRKGRNIEQRVLSRAVGYHLQSRVLMNGHKTVVFRD